ncbi:hypothetical protein EBR96_05005 [bacterium]|nr:hypothetical protein [bacterium]
MLDITQLQNRAALLSGKPVESKENAADMLEAFAVRAIPEDAESILITSHGQEVQNPQRSVSIDPSTIMIVEDFTTGRTAMKFDRASREFSLNGQAPVGELTTEFIKKLRAAILALKQNQAVLYKKPK